MAVVPSEKLTGTFDFVCEVPRCGWASVGWPEEKQASYRGEQHQNEHDTGEATPALHEFEAEVGFKRDNVNTAVAAAVEADLSDEGVELSQKG